MNKKIKRDFQFKTEFKYFCNLGKIVCCDDILSSSTDAQVSMENNDLKLSFRVGI